LHEHAAAGGPSNGLGIKPHQNKQQLRLPTIGLSVYRHMSQMGQRPLQAGGQRKDSICSGLLVLHSCYRHPESAQVHRVTFSSSIKPFTNYSLESRKGIQTPVSPPGGGKGEVLAFPQIAERARRKVNGTM